MCCARVDDGTDLELWQPPNGDNRVDEVALRVSRYARTGRCRSASPPTASRTRPSVARGY